MKTLSFNYSELSILLKALNVYRVSAYDSPSFTSDYAIYLDSLICKFEHAIAK